MAELAAVGAIASILQIAQFTSKAIGRIMEYHDRASGLPKSIRKVTAELVILEFTLKRLQDAFQDSSNDFGSIESFLPTLS
jgi:hypothetical protein